MSDVPSRLLRETLRDQLEPSSSDCLDVEMLAAWSDGTLSRRDRARVESHAASCARCQAMLAAMAKTAAPLQARKWWQASTVRWLVPLATVSTLAVVVWMNVPVERPAAPAARIDATQFPSAAVTLPSETPVPVPAPKPELKGTEQRAAKDTAPGAAAAPTEAVPPATPTLEAAAPPPVAPQEQKTARDEVQRNVAASPPSPAAAAPAPTAPPPARLEPAVAPRATAQLTKILPAQSAADVQARPPLEIPSPDRSVRWRVADNTVQRSTDGGATWQTQSAQGARWTAGAAPSSTICWLVGERGAVLLSKDGLLWQRVAFPEPVDLVAIVATDGSNAAVTVADGRVFITTDGGKTWRSQ